MTDDAPDYATWLPVIGRALARLALTSVEEREPEKYADVLARVGFLESLGLPTRDAAEAAGSTAASVQVMRSRSRTRKANGKKAKKASGRRR